MKRIINKAVLAFLAAVILGLSAASTPAQAQQKSITLTLAGFAVPREAYAVIIPAFIDYWQKKTGQTVVFTESYQASGAQSRAVVGGFEADIVALSVTRDVTRIVDAKLITRDWTANTYKGIGSSSVVVLAVRSDNPKNIADWADIAQPGVEVITPDPATSGGAQWNLLAALGAAQRGKVANIAEKDEAAQSEFLGNILKNVSVFDKDGRESFLTFERGVGDVAITYENEVYTGLANGGDYKFVYPSSTILIENPVAVVDVYAEKHGVLEAADGFVAFLQSPEAQRLFAEKGFRSLDPEVAKEKAFADKYPEVKDLFTIDQFGGWNKVAKDLFGEKGSITALIAEINGQ